MLARRLVSSNERSALVWCRHQEKRMIQALPWQQWAPLWAFAPCLALVTLSDFKEMRIPNAYSVAGLIVFLGLLPLIGWHDALLRGLAAAICFAICLVKFILGWMGGGDTKFLPVVFLFVPTVHLSTYLFLFALFLSLGLVGVLGARRVLRHTDIRAASMQSGAAFPMGVPIGLSALALCLVPIF